MAVEGTLKLDISVDFDGNVVTDAIQDAAFRGIRRVAEALLADAWAYVPVLTGALRDSGHIEEFRANGPDLVVQVVYDLVYAIRQHEEEFNHPSLGFFGAAKYLQKPWEANQPFYAALLEQTIVSRLNTWLGGS